MTATPEADDIAPWRPQPPAAHPNDRLCWGRDGTCTTGRPTEVRTPGWWLCHACERTARGYR